MKVAVNREAFVNNTFGQGVLLNENEDWIKRVPKLDMIIIIGGSLYPKNNLPNYHQMPDQTCWPQKYLYAEGLLLPLNTFGQGVSFNGNDEWMKRVIIRLLRE